MDYQYDIFNEAIYEPIFLYSPDQLHITKANLLHGWSQIDLSSIKKVTVEEILKMDDMLKQVRDFLEDDDVINYDKFLFFFYVNGHFEKDNVEVVVEGNREDFGFVGDEFLNIKKLNKNLK